MSTQTIYGITPKAAARELCREWWGRVANKVSGEDGKQKPTKPSPLLMQGEGIDVSDALSETVRVAR